MAGLRSHGSTQGKPIAPSLCAVAFAVNTILGWIQRSLDHALPAAAFDGAESRRRARLSVLFAWTLLTQVPVFAALFLALGIPQISVLILVAGVLMVLSPRVVKRSVGFGTHYVLGALSFTLLSIVAYTGGLNAPALWWMLATPIMAMMTGGRRAAFGWLTIVLLLTLLLCTATFFGVQFPSFLSPSQRTLLTGVAVAALGFVLFALAMSYESTRDDMLAQVERANRDMKLVFDNVDQGFVTVERDGKMEGQRSAIASRWFGEALFEETLFAWLSRNDRQAGDWLHVGWDAIFDDVLPLAVALDQLPKTLVAKGRTFGLDFRPIDGPDGKPSRVIVITTDITERLNAERGESAQREIVAAFSQLTRDPVGAIQFFEESQAIVDALRAGPPHTKRLIHTLKGNAAMFGLSRLVDRCHQVESSAEQTMREPTGEDRESIARVWDEVALRIAPLVAGRRDMLQVPIADLVELEALIHERATHRQLARVVTSWRYERTSQTFGRMAEQARALAHRLGKGQIEVEVVDHGVRLDPKRFSPLWAAMVHALRNAVDHGIEEIDERRDAGKEGPGRLLLSSRAESTHIVLELGDDGRGIDWPRVAERARRLGLPHDSRKDLEEAVFAAGLSTKNEVSETSGRGVGMAALREVCEELGGRIKIWSEPRLGTRLIIRLPRRVESLAA